MIDEYHPLSEQLQQYHNTDNLVSKVYYQ